MMKIRFLGVLVAGIFAACNALAQNNSFAQKDINIPVNQRVILNYPEYVVYADVLTTENKVKPSDDLFYFWFGANDIKRTRGGFDGKLLHGTYSEFYLNKNLREKGVFKFGLKNGEWKRWYINGELQEITLWKKGVQHGKYILFDEQGRMTERGVYRHGARHGKVYKASPSGVYEVEKYKRGEPVQKKKFRLPFIKRKSKKNKKEKEGPAEDVVAPAEPRQEKDSVEVKKERRAKTEKEKKAGKENKESVGVKKKKSKQKEDTAPKGNGTEVKSKQPDTSPAKKDRKKKNE